MQKICRKCEAGFEITESDRAFLERVSPVIRGKVFTIPPPTLCPSCRMQQRLSFRNERTFYRRTCDHCRKSMVSIYAPGVPYTVYCQECWWSDAWDGTGWGRAFNFSRPFFDQFKELWRNGPLIGLWNISCENAEYNNNCYGLKDSYMSVNSDQGRNYFHCYGVECCSDIVDSTSLYRSELCYECTDGAKLYHCFYSSRLENCSDCFFSTDLVGCNSCFGCHGLRHKEYFLWNEEVSREEWKEKLGSLSFAPKVVDGCLRQSEEVRLRVPHIAVRQMQCENCVGSSLYQCRNVYGCYDVIGGENLRYVVYAPMQSRNVQDAYALGGVDWAYEYLSGGGGISHVAFVRNSANSLSDSYYCNLCVNGSRNLFGCVGLKRKEYCILNREYTKEEYENLLPRVIAHMRSSGEYGEFPASLSPFCYNETKAQEFYPLSKEEALRQGFKWRDPDPREYQKQTCTVPDAIADVPDSICDAVLACTVCGSPSTGSGRPCGRNYKVVPQELRFYRQEKIGIPRTCPDCRHRSRLARRSPCCLFDRTCGKCGREMKSTYSPDRPEIVYCESCYWKEVY